LRIYTRKSLVERLLEKVLITENCWEWLGCKLKGYGQINRGGRGIAVYAHRVMYELLEGHIPVNLVLDHLCRNPACVRPSHLQPVSQKENIRRGISIQAKRMRSDRCELGHLYVFHGKDKAGRVHRRCKECAAKKRASR